MLHIFALGLMHVVRFCIDRHNFATTGKGGVAGSGCQQLSRGGTDRRVLSVTSSDLSDIMRIGGEVF
jgi:hypothetical protein